MTTEILPAEAAPPVPTAWKLFEHFVSFETEIAAFERFLGFNVANAKASEDTIKAYRQGVRVYLRWCVATGVVPAMATVWDMENYRHHLQQEFSTATVQFYMTAVRRFYDAAKRYEMVKANPADGLRVGGRRTTDDLNAMKALSSKGMEQLASVLQERDLEGKRVRAAIALMGWQGLRRVECHRANHENVLESETPVFRVDGKGGKERYVILRADVHEALRDWTEEKAFAGFDVTGSAPLFVGLGNRSAGKRLSRQWFNQMVDEALAEAGLKRDGVSCHALRHTFGTQAVAGGAKVEHLRDAMGHANLETTGVYVQAVERSKNNPAACIEASL